MEPSETSIVGDNIEVGRDRVKIVLSRYAMRKAIIKKPIETRFFRLTRKMLISTAYQQYEEVTRVKLNEIYSVLPTVLQERGYSLQNITQNFLKRESLKRYNLGYQQVGAFKVTGGVLPNIVKQRTSPFPGLIAKSGNYNFDDLDQNTTKGVGPWVVPSSVNVGGDYKGSGSNLESRLPFEFYEMAWLIDAFEKIDENTMNFDECFLFLNLFRNSFSQSIPGWFKQLTTPGLQLDPIVETFENTKLFHFLFVSLFDRTERRKKDYDFNELQALMIKFYVGFRSLRSFGLTHVNTYQVGEDLGHLPGIILIMQVFAAWLAGIDKIYYWGENNWDPEFKQLFNNLARFTGNAGSSYMLGYSKLITKLELPILFPRDLLAFFPDYQLPIVKEINPLFSEELIASKLVPKNPILEVFPPKEVESVTQRSQEELRVAEKITQEAAETLAKAKKIELELSKAIKETRRVESALESSKLLDPVREKSKKLLKSSQAESQEELEELTETEELKELKELTKLEKLSQTPSRSSSQSIEEEEYVPTLSSRS